MRSRGRRAFVALAAMLVLLGAPSAVAGVIYTVDAFTSDGSPLSAVPVGAEIILDITVRTTDFALGVAGSANGYDNSILGLSYPQTRRSDLLFIDDTCVPTVGCWSGNGLRNQQGGSTAFSEHYIGAGVEAEFLAAVGLEPARGDGSLDPGVITGVPGDPQFRLVYAALMPGSTIVNFGSYAEYLDGYLGTEDSETTNTSVSITVVPEPGTALLVGLGLSSLAIRRSR